MKIYYLGPQGSYSHILAQKVFAKDAQFIACDSFFDVIRFVQQDSQSIGALAIENSISSSVHQTVDLLYNTDVCIVGEASMYIALQLLGIASSNEQEIKKVYSHPQALAQCSEYIAKHKLIPFETLSTSAAVHRILEDNSQDAAAIANIESFEDKNLVILNKDIANVPNNMTRWVFIAQRGSPALSKTINKVTYIFKVKHEPGSLVMVLDKMAKLKGNLTKIESRPLPGTHWEYGFWIDIEIEEHMIQQVDDMMKETTLECRRVGAYEKGKLYS